MTRQLSVLALLALAGGASAQTCVSPTIPGGNDPVTGLPYQGPGACPATVTAANFQVSLRPGTILGANDNNGDQALKVFPIVSGPLNWTSGWTNEGDIDANIAPAEPSNPLSYPPDAFIRLQNQGGLRTYAWSISMWRGSVMVVPRVNGRDNQDFLFSGGPNVGTLYGLANVSANTFRSGSAYDMVDGTFRNGNESMYLSMHFAGTVGNQEMSFNIGAAWFPFQNGWTGGYLNNTGYSAGQPVGFIARDTLVASTPGLANSVANWGPGGIAPQISISLPDVDSASDGILFAQPWQDNNDPAFVSVNPSNGGWDLTYRFTRTDGLSELVDPGSGNVKAHFVYVPYCASNLVAARINGSDGQTVNGTGAFSLNRNGTGQYFLSIPGQSDATGTLLLQSVGTDGDSALGSRVFFSYAPSEGGFLIQGRTLQSGNNVFGEDAVLTDGSFYFAWISHSTPPGSCCAADFNGDNQVDFFDYLDFAQAFSTEDPSADFNGDNQIDFFDYLDFAQAFDAGCE